MPSQCAGILCHCHGNADDHVQTVDSFRCGRQQLRYFCEIDCAHQMKIQQLYRDERGAALVEFTVVLPLWLSLTFGIVQAGLMLWAQIGLQHGVELAARCASFSDIAIHHGGLDPSATPTPCYTLRIMLRLMRQPSRVMRQVIPLASIRPLPRFSSIPPRHLAPNGNLVTASYPFTAIAYLFSITLTAQSCYPTDNPEWEAINSWAISRNRWITDTLYRQPTSLCVAKIGSP